MRAGFVFQSHNEFRDLEAELLNMVCKDAVTELVLQDVKREQFTQGSNKAQDARLDIHAHGLLEPQQTAFLIMRKSINTQVECLILNMEHSPL